jgi:hypothetical protein
MSYGRNYRSMFLWVFFGFVYASLTSQWISANSRDKSFTEYIDYVLQVAATEQRSTSDIRTLILVKAEDLSLQVHGDDIHINGYGQTLTAAVQYQTEIHLPIVNRPVYRMSFQHNLALKGIQ